MIEGIKTWLLGVVAAALCLSIFYAVMPGGTMRVIGRVSGGLVLILVMLQPPWEGQSISLQHRYREYQQTVEQQSEVYSDSYQQQLQQSIEETTAAYICEKAAEMGMECNPNVITQLREGVPVPVEVELDIAHNTKLEDWIAEQLGIAEDRQHWKETP